MIEEIEIYVLSNKRELPIIESFFNSFMKERILQGDMFCIPEFECDKPEIVFYDDKGILDYLISNPTEDYGLYWKSLIKSNIYTAMIFFTEDKNIIFGLATINNAQEMLITLKNHLKSDIGYIAFAEVPPLSLEKFIERCKESEEYERKSNNMLK